MRTGAVVVVAMTVAHLGACSFGCSFDAPRAQPPAGSFTVETVTLRVDGSEQQAGIARITPEFFATSGIKPSLGRFFLPAEYQPGGIPVAVLSHASWKERFGGEPAVIGQRIELGGQTVVVVGVAASQFDFPQGTMIAVPQVR